MKYTFSVTESDAGQRLDIFLKSHVPDVSRSEIQKAITDGDILVNQQQVKPKYAVKDQDEIQVNLEKTPAAIEQEQTPINIPIIYEDKDIVVIDKPAGLTTHPGIANERQTVASWFAEHYPESKVGEDPSRYGIVHRLDKDTSGVMVLAKTQRAYNHLKDHFKQRHAKKEYAALVFGVPKDSDGTISAPLARSQRNPMRRTVDPEGKPAMTEWQLTTSYQGRYSLLHLFPRTGRTHQLRAHLHHVGYPIIGDALYTFKRQKPPQGVTRQMLHAYKLSFDMLAGGLKTFTAPLPQDMNDVIEHLT